MHVDTPLPRGLGSFSSAPLTAQPIHVAPAAWSEEHPWPLETSIPLCLILGIVCLLSIRGAGTGDRVRSDHAVIGLSS